MANNSTAEQLAQAKNIQRDVTKSRGGKGQKEISPSRSSNLLTERVPGRPVGSGLNLAAPVGPLTAIHSGMEFTSAHLTTDPTSKTTGPFLKTLAPPPPPLREATNNRQYGPSHPQPTTATPSTPEPTTGTQRGTPHLLDTPTAIVFKEFPVLEPSRPNQPKTDTQVQEVAGISWGRGGTATGGAGKVVEKGVEEPNRGLMSSRWAPK